MDPAITAVMDACTIGSDDERLTFPQVIMQLMAAGVERYGADLSRSEKIYYLPDGTSHRVPCRQVAQQPALAFSPAGVEAAIRAIQVRSITYREFCSRIASAGCIGYVVSLAGRRAVYFGRTGDLHVEHFPAAS
jgi:uncharacterized protein YbcV (DUF1398 family)